MRPSKLFLAVSGFLVSIGAIGLAIAAYWQWSTPYSPPDRVRPWAIDRWEEFTSDRSLLAPVPSFSSADFFDAFEVSVDSSDIRVSLPDATDWHYRPNYEHFDGRNAASPRSPSFAKLSAIGVVSHTSDPIDQNPSRETPPERSRSTVRFFDMEGSPLDEAPWTQQPHFLNQPRPSYHPRLFLRLDHASHPQLSIDSIRFFDQLTQVDLSRSGVTSPPIVFEGYTIAVADHLSWRRNQTLAAIDVSLGPDFELELSPKEDSEAAGNGHVLRILRIASDFQFGGSASFHLADHSIEYQGLVASAGSSSGSSSSTGFIIAAYPFGSRSSIEFEAFDRDGNPLKTKVTTSFQMPYLVTCEAPLESIGSLRATVPSRYARLLIPLPNLPALPPANDDLEDLFDMAIPHYESRHQNGHETAVYQLTQLSASFLGGSLHAGFPPPKPTTMNGTSPREILELAGRQYQSGSPFRTNSRDCTIAFGQDSPPEWWVNFKNWCTGWMP